MFPLAANRLLIGIRIVSGGNIPSPGCLDSILPLIPGPVCASSRLHTGARHRVYLEVPR